MLARKLNFFEVSPCMAAVQRKEKEKSQILYARQFFLKLFAVHLNVSDISKYFN